MIPNDKKRGKRKKKREKKPPYTQKSNHFFLTGYFLAFFYHLFFSELVRFPRNGRVKIEECGVAAIWSGNTEGFDFFSLLFSLSYYGRGFFFLFSSFFLFFFFPFSYLLSISFVHGYRYFNSCIGRVHLIYTFAFSSLYNLAYFFSLALLHIIILILVCFCGFFQRFCEFPFLSGHYIDHKKQRIGERERFGVFWIYSVFFRSHYNLPIYLSTVFCLFLCAPFFALRQPYLPYPPSIIIMGRKKKNTFSVRVYIYHLVTGLSGWYCNYCHLFPFPFPFFFFRCQKLGI